MTELFLIVEGDAEERFVNRSLRPHLEAHSIFAKPKCLRGLTKYAKVKKELQAWMRRDCRSALWFTTMIDLYRLPSSFPGFQDTARIPDPYRRVEELERYWSDDVKDSRFVPYIQLHEFESLLFSDPAKFVVFYPARTQRGPIERLKAISEKNEPERIDDGPNTSPSKRILAELPEYQKPVAGPQIADAIGLVTIREKCPHFDGWLKKLEALGRTDRG